MNALHKFGNLALGLVALVQVGIAITEMFFWKNPIIYGRVSNLFGADVAVQAAPIVANAGLYNAFIAAGIIWGLLGAGNRVQIKLFFLVCVIVAGIFGGVTLKSGGPLVLQTIPGTIALLLVWMCRAEKPRRISTATIVEG
ncbi:MAG: DUF1304 domain-containing protein [Candidatus Angelobacter sp. Gp1-AA117]|nr:MAG: DUF1304 domain-containing protein [Candidatus Angelobacter sp. Gp1-AA117]